MTFSSQCCYFCVVLGATVRTWIQELEEGEISTPAASEGAATKTEGETEDAPAKPLTAAEQRAAERKKAEADRAARRRMLGNIQFIGHLFKEHLLTER